jgi:mitotic-spindle organizing protein 1
VVHEISQLLNTGLDRKSVQILMALCDAGVNPSALAAIVLELRRAAKEASAAPAGGAAGGAAGRTTARPE